MTSGEIRRQIDFNNQQIEQAMKPNHFTLNTVVRDLLNENAKLQKQCKHEIVDGYCTICDFQEGEE